MTNQPTNPLTEQQLDDIEARAQAATPGPWRRPLNTRYKHTVTGPLPEDEGGAWTDGIDPETGEREQCTVAMVPIWSNGRHFRQRGGRDLEYIAAMHPEVAKALVAEVRRLSAELDVEKAQHSFTLRQRNNRSERLNYLRDLAKSGQTDLLAEEAVNTLAASVNDHAPAEGDEMAASLRRDGFGDDEIADILARPAAVAAVETGE